MRNPGFLVLGLIVLGMSQDIACGQSQEIPNLVTIEQVKVSVSAIGPVVLLIAENRVIPIFVDPTVAGSIDGALTGRKFPRPLSHDLMHSILQGFGGVVSSVTVRLQEKIYFGEIAIKMNGEEKTFDSRSSDAIALAIHFKAPILVGRDLLESAAENLLDEDPPQQLL